VKTLTTTFVIIRTLAVVATAGIVAVNAHAASCNINMGSNQQAIDGFGFSSAWSGQLSSAKNNALYNTLGMSLLRIRIDPNQYWADETANASVAHAHGVKVLGTPWSPPAYMKDNNNVVHGSLRTDQYANYANYLNQAANSIGLDYVSVQNEPDWNPDYEGCVWSGDQMKNFCANNAPAIGKPVVMAEALGFNDAYSDPTLNDVTAASHVSFIAGHFYGSGNYVHQNALNKGKHVWMTEHYIDNAQASMANCINIAKEMNDALNNQFSAYFWWWVADYDSSVNLVDSNGNIFKNGYTIGQFAKWIRPGSTRVSADYNPSSNVYVTAYRVNGGTVIVAVHTGGSSLSQQFNVQNGNAATFEGYRTSGSENMADIGSMGVSGTSFTATLPAVSVTTFVQTSSQPTPIGVTFYQDYNYAGAASQALAAGSYTTAQLAAQGVVNDWASSVRVPSGYTVTLYQNDNFSGTSWTVTSDTPNFGALSPSANDQVSSVIVRGTGPTNGTYKLIARHSGKAMDAYGAQTTNGTQIIQWGYGGGANQKWMVTDTGGGNYSIIGVQSGKSLDVNNGATANGTKVQLWDSWGGPMQLFQFAATDSGYYRITPNSATGSCLDVSGVSTADGANVQLWQWLGGSNQQWAPQVP